MIEFKFDPSDITLAQDTIHNPADGRHLMKVKPVTRLVEAHFRKRVLAESRNAVRVLEIGYDFYDPIVYFPRDDITADLAPSVEKKTHCPLKGDASYFDLVASDGTKLASKIAWSYEKTYAFSAQLNGLIAFDPAKIIMTEGPD